MEAIQYPALNLNGLQSGWVGDQQRTILPSSATVALDVRLVEGNDPDDMLDKITNHVKKQGYHVVTEEPEAATRRMYPLIAKVERKEGGYRASRTPMDHPLSLAAIKALTEQSENKPVLLPSLAAPCRSAFSAICCRSRLSGFRSPTMTTTSTRQTKIFASEISGRESRLMPRC